MLACLAAGWYSLRYLDDVLWLTMGAGAVQFALIRRSAGFFRDPAEDAGTGLSPR